MPSQPRWAHINELTARAVDRIGAADFYDCLLAVLSAVVPNDLAAMVRYSRSAPPDLILPRVDPTTSMIAYYQHFYAFDPYYNHWSLGAISAYSGSARWTRASEAASMPESFLPQCRSRTKSLSFCRR